MKADSARVAKIKCVITHALSEAGIGFSLARTWSGPLALEKRFKRQQRNPAFCPTCCAKKGKRARA